jgi:hypothetical protein
MAEDSKRGGCLKWALIGGAGLFGLVVLGVALGDPVPPADAPEAALPATILTVTAPELHAAFAANEVAAKARFGDQPLRVTGVIDAIELDLFDNPQLSLRAGGDFEFVLAKFDKDAAAQTAALAKGQDITVVCDSVTEVIGNPVLDDCAIEE